MRLEGDCVETWPQGMVMSGSGAARVEILRSAWVLCDYLQRRNVQTDLKECSHTSPSLPHCPMFGISQAASLHHFYTALQLQLSTMKGAPSNQTVSRALEAAFGAILN